MTYTTCFIHAEDRPGRWLITCDHATNTVPPDIGGGSLGLPREDMERHIAYDVGAHGVQARGEIADLGLARGVFQDRVAACQGSGH